MSMYVDKDFWTEVQRLKAEAAGPKREVSVTVHAIDRWRQRLDPRGRERHIRSAMRRAVEVPAQMRAYFSLADHYGLWWDEKRAVLLVTTTPEPGRLRVVTVYRPRAGQRRLLERHSWPESQAA